MKYLLLVVLLSFTSCCLFAQLPKPAMLWMKGYGGNSVETISNHVVKTLDNGFLVHIETNSNFGTGNLDSFCSYIDRKQIFLKYNYDASVLDWSKCFPVDGDSFILHVFPDSDGGLVLGGEFTGSVGWGFLISKQDAIGNIVWQHNYSKGNGAFVNTLMPTHDGGYIMLGESLYTDTNALVHYGSFMDADYWVLKVDSNGNKVWSRIIGGSGPEGGGTLVPAPGNGCYIVGGTGSNDYDCTGNHGSADVYLARLDSNGNLLWHKNMGGSAQDIGVYGVENGNGGVIIVAKSNSVDGDVKNHQGGTDYWLIEVDSSGQMLWNNSIGTTGGDEYPNAICKATDGSIWVTGYCYGDFDTSYGREDAWIVHTDDTGKLLNGQLLGSNRYDHGTMIYELDNGLVITGGDYYNNSASFSSLGNFGSNDVFLAVFAPWTTNIHNVSDNTNNHIFPNPAKDHIEISNLQSGKEYQVRLVDIIGRNAMLASVNIDNNTIRLDALAKGLYVLQISDGAGSSTTQKIIIQ